MAVETRLYEQLGLQPDASPDEIRRSYRQCALRWHPDRNQGDAEAAENFKACLQAYEILSEPQTRAAYDAHGLSGVVRTAEAAPDEGHADDDERRHPTHETYEASSPPPQQDQRFRQRFDGDPMDAFQSFFFRETTAPSTRLRHGHGHHHGGNAFSYQTSWSFQTGGSDSSSGRGSYTTHIHTWNSRDGHRSASEHGTLGGDGGQGPTREPFAALGQFPAAFGSWGQGFDFPAGGPFRSSIGSSRAFDESSGLQGQRSSAFGADPFGLLGGMLGTSRARYRGSWFL